MWGLGILWAAFAPLLLLIPGGLLVLVLSFTGWPRYARIAIAAGLVTVTVGAFWWQDHKQFVSVCDEIGKPRIFVRATADGIYLDSPTANSFGMNYLHRQGFAWMEMRSIYDRNKIERVTREADGQIRTAPTATISARYEVRETFEQPYSHTGLSMTRVIDRQTGTVMAQAGSATFNGGRMHWVLGVYGTRTCPDAMTESNDFLTYYYLAQRTLRPAKQ